MSQELKILKSIENTKNITQRDIAKNTGMSLGAVNILIKRLVKKGLVKIERINPRLIRYILTPHGLREKASLTLNYITNSYNYIKNIEDNIITLLNTDKIKNIKHIYIYGNNDEVFKLLSNKIIQAKKQFSVYNDIDSLKNIIKKNNQISHIMIAWEAENIEELISSNLAYINLFEHF